MLRVRVLGGMEVELEGTAVAATPSQRPWALFGYLALRPASVSRAELVQRFWPDVTESSARASLRSALWALRREVGDVVVADRDRIALRDGDGLWVDIREFERLAQAGESEQALSLCRGELLEGVGDEWALLARERHRHRVIGVLEELARECAERGESESMLAWTRRQVDCDPLDEEVARRLIERLGENGDRAGALRTYRALAERLRSELRVVPSRQTRTLVDRLLVDAPQHIGSRAPRAHAPTPEMLGREHELARLEGAWSGVHGGTGCAVIIRGAAGIGKTRLANELRSKAVTSAGLCATGAALDLGGTAPLSLWAEVIRDLLPALSPPPAEAAWPADLGVLAGDVPQHFGRSGAAGPDVAPELQRTRLFEAVISMLEWASRKQPLLVVLEDLHAADPDSLGLAAYVGRRLATMRVMLVCTRRDLPPSGAADRLEEALSRRGVLADHLSLEALSADRVAALINDVARLSDEDALRCVTLSEGNPLLAVETARAMAAGLRAPAPNLRSSMRAALEPLEGDVRRLLEVAAVAAREIEAPELDALGLESAEEAATRALETGLLVAADRGIGFRHALLREAVYAEIAEPRRRGLHERWAAAVTARPERAAEIARHLLLAGRDSEAVAHLAAAADQARSVAALDGAAAYLQEALAIAPERVDLVLELGEVEAWRGRRVEAEAAFARAESQLRHDAPEELVRALLRKARAYHGPICVPRAVQESSRAALELLDRAGLEAPAERHEALAALAWAEAVAGSVDDAERLIAQLSQSPGLSDLEIYDLSHAEAFALMRRGRFADSYASSVAAGEAIERAGRADLSYGCWANAASAATAIADYERALEFLARGQAVVAANGLRSLVVHMLAARAFVLVRLHRLRDAEEFARAAWGLAEELGLTPLSAMAQHDLAMVLLEAGNATEAASLLTRALATPDAPISRPSARIALAEAHARCGSSSAAGEELRAAVLEPVRPSDFPETLVPRLERVQGLAAAAGGDHAGALRRLRESVASWERVVARISASQSIAAVLADLGRPVVGVVDPERELSRARAEERMLEEEVDRAIVS